MSHSLTDRLQQERFKVVAVDRERGVLRVKGEACRDLACHAHTVVITEDGTTAGVDALVPGDIVRIESRLDGGGPGSATGAGDLPLQRVVVLRRVWEGNASPEL